MFVMFSEGQARACPRAHRRSPRCKPRDPEGGSHKGPYAIRCPERLRRAGGAISAVTSSRDVIALGHVFVVLSS
jgi:hypothetical protein